MALAAILACNTTTPATTSTPIPDTIPLRLTRSPNTELNPAWSPIGDKIAFQCFNDGEPISRRQATNRTMSSSKPFTYPGNICIMNADGSGRLQLTDNTSDDSDPAWSPDSAKVAFSSRREGNTDIYMMNADGSQLQRLTDGEGDDTHPTWSPDGNRIAFASASDGRSDIFDINPDGSRLRQITDDDSHDSEPAWSPDGTRIAFTSFRNERSAIYAVNPDGSQRELLLGPTGKPRSPAWSPEGETIAFTSEVRYWTGSELKQREIFTLDINGSELTRITDSAWQDLTPAWHPDGTKLAFASNPAGNWDIYVIDVQR